MAINVVSILKNKYPKVKLWMVGGGDKLLIEQIQKKITDLSLTENIILTGKLTHKDWAKLSNNASFFINTTFIDNMPVSVLQSMALGIPVISTNVGGIEWLIKNKINGFKCESNNEKEMAEIIDNLLTNPSSINKVILNALEMTKGLSWEEILPMWDEILLN